MAAGNNALRLVVYHYRGIRNEQSSTRHRNSHVGILRANLEIGTENRSAAVNKQCATRLKGADINVAGEKKSVRNGQAAIGGCTQAETRLAVGDDELAAIQGDAPRALFGVADAELSAQGDSTI